MNPVWLGASAAAGVGLGGLGWATWAGLKRRGLNRWLVPYFRSRHTRRPLDLNRPQHVFLAVCDHYEPYRGDASPAKAAARVRQWVEEYPRLFDRFRDADGRPPQHTFFYPEEEYDADLMDQLAGLCRAGYGEVEIHLHHDNDTPENLRQNLQRFKAILRDRHGLLSRDRLTGETSYGFIHGNWALDNARSDGRHCGIANELDLLLDTGCYADFTLPSAPSETQTHIINSVYWAVGEANRCKSHDTGPLLGVAPRPERGLLMIQGPLTLDWSKRKFQVMPGIENANLQKSQPPTERRLDLWLRCGVRVVTMPDWTFIKLHTHGVQEPNQEVLLGGTMVRLHEVLQERATANRNFIVHYVTAREMANLTLAAAEGWTGSVVDARNYRYRQSES